MLTDNQYPHTEQCPQFKPKHFLPWRFVQMLSALERKARGVDCHISLKNAFTPLGRRRWMFVFIVEKKTHNVDPFNSN